MLRVLIAFGAFLYDLIKAGDLDFTAAFFNLSLVRINVLSSLFIQGEHFSDTSLFI